MDFENFSSSLMDAGGGGAMTRSIVASFFFSSSLPMVRSSLSAGRPSATPRARNTRDFPALFRPTSRVKFGSNSREQSAMPRKLRMWQLSTYRGANWSDAVVSSMATMIPELCNFSSLLGLRAHSGVERNESSPLKCNWALCLCESGGGLSRWAAGAAGPGREGWARWEQGPPVGRWFRPEGSRCGVGGTNLTTAGLGAMWSGWASCPLTG